MKWMSGKVQVFVSAHFTGKLSAYRLFNIVNANGAGDVNTVAFDPQIRKCPRNFLRVAFLDKIQQRV